MVTLTILNFLLFLQMGLFVVGYISGNQLFPEPLSPEEEQEYLNKLQQGDEEARNILIERNLRWVAHISKKYTSNPNDQDDLISIGTIGLMKGIQSLDRKSVV